MKEKMEAVNEREEEGRNGDWKDGDEETRKKAVTGGEGEEEANEKGALLWRKSWRTKEAERKKVRDGWVLDQREGKER